MTQTRNRLSVQDNPYILRAVATLRGRGWRDVEVQQALRMSRRTLYLCIAAIRERKERAERDD